SYLAHLLGIPHIVVAVNKMDLVDYSAEVFDSIRRDYLAFAGTLGLGDVRFLPMSALHGEMIVERGDRLPWYDGPTLFDLLETTTAIHSAHAEKFRFPVQYVCRPQDAANPELHDYRGFMGRVESGQVAVGDAVTVLPAGHQSRIKAIEVFGQSLPQAIAEQSVTLLLTDEIDISRGDMIVKTGESPTVSKQVEAMLCWLSETPLDPRRKYLIRHTTRDSKAMLAGIAYRLDINSLAQQPAERLVMNDIARVGFKLAQPLFVDPYAESRGTGAFIVIDESTNATVGAGMIL
ncbi:MAG TPA: sulfate adenylyltransferase, partial [Accumulibacter sp.]|nr:sulfate adenylyltransferase [Accumulibacter sp.]